MPTLTAAFAADMRVRVPEDGAGNDRTVDFVLSNAAIDSCGDTIKADGWRLDRYRRNNRVLWAHDNDIPPIANGIDVHIADGMLKGTADFVPHDLWPFADTIFRFIKAGFLSAVSVGFLPVRWEWSKDPARPWGIDFLEQELVEFSVVNVPANADALIDEGLLAGAGLAIDPDPGPGKRNVLAMAEYELAWLDMQ